jgi:protein-S-isoprenylcysteine O-methyltransferase Ste14
MSDDNPGIKFPPPLVFLVAILVGVGLKRIWPMSVVPDSLAIPLGVAFITAAFSLAFLGFRELKRHETTPRPDQASSAIVKSGPYRFTRNPLYVSLSMLHLGIGLLTNNLWVVSMLIPVWIVMTTQVIAREERYLARAFGDEYSSYKASVRRWI